MSDTGAARPLTPRAGGDTPAVAVVVPAYDPGRFLRPALDSVLLQTLTDWECVVVDDGSSEDLGWVDDLDPRVRRLRQDNRGLSAARNAGVAATSAPLVAFLDADDLWSPDKLDAQVRALDEDPGLALVSTRFEIIDDDGHVTGPGFEGHHDSYEALLEGCGICVSTVVVRRSVLDRVGLFDTSLRGVQDWDLWLRIARDLRISRLDAVLAQYRVHRAGMSKDWRMTRREAHVVLGRHDHPGARVGIARADELAAYQAFDAARSAWRSSRIGDGLRDLAFVALHRPAVLWEAAATRRHRRSAQSRGVDAADLARIEAISLGAAEADGAEPLDEGAWRRLRHHGDELATYVEPGRGFSVVDGELLHLVVAPEARGQGVGGRLLAAAMGDRAGPWQAWSHGDHPAAAALARSTGFERTRELWVMRRSLAGAGELRHLDLRVPGLAIRPFEPGDEPELLRVNAAAFAHHPEQGSMDAAELAERMAEPWFDPADLIVAAQGDRMYGFHWTKRHSATLGEVYVVAVDPEVHGRGLGNALVDVGLRHLRSRGLEDVLLYVESENAPAVHLYEKLGFTHAATDTHVMYTRGVSAPGS